MDTLKLFNDARQNVQKYPFMCHENLSSGVTIVFNLDDDSVNPTETLH